VYCVWQVGKTPTVILNNPVYIHISDTCTTVSTILPIVSVWDSRMHYKFWYIWSVLWKAWWWLNRVETCCHKNILCNKLLRLTEIYILYELDKHIGMNNVKLIVHKLSWTPLEVWSARRTDLFYHRAHSVYRRRKPCQGRNSNPQSQKASSRNAPKLSH